MNMEREKLLSAYVDGELSAENLDWVEGLLTKDREAGVFVDTITKTNRLLKDAYNPIFHQSLPASLLPHHRKNWLRRFTNPLYIAAAASVALVVFIGGYLASDFMTRQELDVMHQKLAELRRQTLEYSPSGTPVSWNDASGLLNITVEPLKTFRTPDNHYCREYREIIKEGSDTEVRIGVACRSGKTQWDVQNESTQQKSDNKADRNPGNPKVIL